MTERASNGSPEELTFSTAFAKAKRNVLWWSLITLLIAVGTAGEGSALEVQTFVKGLTYQHRFLIAGSVTVLIVMTLGYMRAWSRVMPDHLAITQIERLNQSIDALANLHEISVDTEARARGAIEKYDQVQAALSLERSPPGIHFSDEYGEQFVEQLFKRMVGYDQLPGQGPRRAFKPDLPKAIAVIKEIYANGGTSMLDQLKNATATDPREIETQQDLPLRAEKISSAAEGALSELRTLRTRISRSARLWHAFDDHTVVLGAVVLALLASAYSWADPNSFDAKITRALGVKAVSEPLTRSTVECPEGCTVTIPPHIQSPASSKPSSEFDFGPASPPSIEASQPSSSSTG